MAVERKYTEQMPFVGTGTQKQHLERTAGRRRSSVAAVLRDLIDREYGLVDGEEPEGQEGTPGTE